MMRLILCLLFSLTFWYVIQFRSDTTLSRKDSQGPRYQPYIAGYLLPLFLALMLPIGYLFVGAEHTGRMMLSMCFSVFLHICLYYALLIPLISFLRQRISSRACAVLWLIPTYLYITQYGWAALPAPLFIITTPGKLVWVLLGIWFAGFIGVLIWNIGVHLHLRKQILDAARIHPSLEARQQWKLSLAQYGFRNADIPLMASPRVSTPMTIGLIQSSTVVVLPERAYSPDELALIFHHEIVHIGRQDSWGKFFLIFCTAMCWFNPLMWIAMRKSADDMELSCDEAVLQYTDDETKKRYADLILTTAGDHRGFTTCLSASAEALRYRLKNIVMPEEKSNGAVAVALAFFLLSMTSGFVALAYDGTTGAEVLFQSDIHSGYTLEVLSSSEPGSGTFQITDEAQLGQYLSELPMYRLTGQYSFSTRSREMMLQLDMPQRVYWLFLYDDIIELYPLHGANPRPEYYYIPDGIDWNCLDSLITS